MNQAQHIWLAIMTELALERMHGESWALESNWHKHLSAAGVTWPDLGNVVWMSV